MNGRFQRFERFDFPVLVLLSLLFFATVVGAFLRERDEAWHGTQERFAALLERNGQLEAARSFHAGIRQLWIPELDRVDRCVTCHLGYEWTGTLPADLPEPFTPHPAVPYLRAHPFKEFGCTSCHGGQGFAVEKKAAHGELLHWDDPLITTRLAADYGLKRNELMQVKCNECHRHQDSTSAMERINTAKDLFVRKKCRHCHTVARRGGTTGPDLTYEGDKNPELFDFSHVEGKHTALNWHFAHLNDPDAVTPGTQMPPYGFSEDEIKALALMLISWKKIALPPRYLPVPLPAEVPAVVRKPHVPPVVAGADAGRSVFVKRGCASCHAVGAGTVIGPDLKGVGGRRTKQWLRQWLADPATMLRAYPDLADWPSGFGGIIMPNQNLTTAEIDALVVYLAGI